MEKVIHMTHENLWKPTILATPRLLFPDLHKETLPQEFASLQSPAPFDIYRSSSRHSSEIYSTNIEYTGEFLIHRPQLMNLGVKLPICRLANAHRILPSLYSHIVTAIHDEDYEQYLIPIEDNTQLPTIRRPARHLPLHEIFPREITRQVVKPPVPQRVVNVFIESAIAKGDTCPVSMYELECSTSHVTPCWHILSETAIQWVEERGECPLCKQTCSVDSLLQWREL